MNLLRLGNFILRLLSDVMCSTLEPLRSGCDGWSGCGVELLEPLRGCWGAERHPLRCKLDLLVSSNMRHRVTISALPAIYGATRCIFFVVTVWRALWAAARCAGVSCAGALSVWRCSAPWPCTRQSPAACGRAGLCGACCDYVRLLHAPSTNAARFLFRRGFPSLSARPRTPSDGGGAVREQCAFTWLHGAKFGGDAFHDWPADRRRDVV